MGCSLPSCTWHVATSVAMHGPAEVVGSCIELRSHWHTHGYAAHRYDQDLLLSYFCLMQSGPKVGLGAMVTPGASQATCTRTDKCERYAYIQIIPYAFEEVVDNLCAVLGGAVSGNTPGEDIP